MQVDKAALEAQVAAKKAAAEKEKALNKYYDDMALGFDQQLSMLEQKRREAQVSMNKEVAAYRAAEQGRATRREYDLSDPMTLLKDVPARVDDADPRCGASGMQRFDGEDLGCAAREAAQMRQQAEWARQQIDEKRSRAAAEKSSMAAYGALLRQQEAAQNDFAAQEAAARKAAAKETASYVAQQMAEKADRKAAERSAELQANAAEQEAVSTSLFMTEDPITGVSTLRTTRVRTDHWKGMNAQQMADIRAVQEEQRQAIAQRRAAERGQDNEYAQYADAVNAKLCVASQEVEMKKREARLQIAQAHRAQMAEKKDRDAALAQLYSNKPDDAFFAQFGTSHR